MRLFKVLYLGAFGRTLEHAQNLLEFTFTLKAPIVGEQYGHLLHSEQTWPFSEPLLFLLQLQLLLTPLTVFRTHMILRLGIHLMKGFESSLWWH
jgi:hypothetical protein